MADVTLTKAEDTQVWVRYTATLTAANNTTEPFSVMDAEHVAFYQTADQTGAGTAFSSIDPLLLTSDKVELATWVAGVQTAGVVRSCTPDALVASAEPGYVRTNMCGGVFMRLKGTSATATKSMAIEIVVYRRW